MSADPTLKHVCMWHNKNWVAISAKEAYEKIGRSGASSKSGLFICDLCGQYVSLVSGQIQVPHFRHSKQEADKNCKERALIRTSEGSYDPKEHTLPIRIVKNSFSNTYRFELGLIRAPTDELDENFRAEIQPCNMIYGIDNINTDSISYLSLGNTPHESYTLILKHASEELRSFWPETTPGVNHSGSIFDKHSGVKLNVDADVVLKKEYLLLTKEPVPISNRSSVAIKLLEMVSIRDWYMYEVRANEFDEYAANFFIRYHCRLTDAPTTIQPIWPLYVEGSYMIRHSSKHLYMLLRGYTRELKSYPSKEIKKLSCINNDVNLYRISCAQKQQLVSTGRSNVLQYTYLWQEPLSRNEPQSIVSVSDLDENPFSSGRSFNIPRLECLKIKVSFDGHVVIKNKGLLTRRINLDAEKATTIHDLSIGSTVHVFIGHDLVWHHEFIRKPDAQAINYCDEKIYRSLKSQYGSIMKAPHTLRNIQAGLNEYPKTSKWVSKCLDEGEINVRAYHLLTHLYRNLNKTHNTII